MLLICSDTTTTYQEPSYEMVNKLRDVKLESNPAYAVPQGSSEDHHYDVIPARHHAKAN